MGKKLREVIQKWHTIGEIKPVDGDRPFTGVILGDEEVLRVNEEASWEIDRVFTDYRWDEKPHEVFVVVFKRKEEAT